MRKAMNLFRILCMPATVFVVNGLGFSCFFQQVANGGGLI
jgi:hypothetical protein